MIGITHENFMEKDLPFLESCTTLCNSLLSKVHNELLFVMKLMWKAQNFLEGYVEISIDLTVTTPC